MGKTRTWMLLAAILMPTLGTGCNVGTFNPFTMGIYTPIPVQPWVAERMEEKFCHKNDHRTPIMPPIREGFPPPICEDPPSEEEIVRAMPMVARGVPYIYEEFRDDIEIVTELLVDRIDPPRFYPLVGPAQLHHCHYKCIIYYTETVQSDYPFPYMCRRPRVEVIYIDKDHLHLYVGTDPAAQQAVTRDLIGYQ
jgi:hypothetical protein